MWNYNCSKCCEGEEFGPIKYCEDETWPCLEARKEFPLEVTFEGGTKCEQSWGRGREEMKRVECSARWENCKRVSGWVQWARDYGDREAWRLLQGLCEDLCVKTWAVLRTLVFIIRTMLLLKAFLQGGDMINSCLRIITLAPMRRVNERWTRVRLPGKIQDA